LAQSNPGYYSYDQVHLAIQRCHILQMTPILR